VSTLSYRASTLSQGLEQRLGCDESAEDRLEMCAVHKDDIGRTISNQIERVVGEAGHRQQHRPQRWTADSAAAYRGGLVLVNRRL